MIAADQHLLPDNMGQRLVFIAEMLKQGEIPDADKQPISRQELETLRKIAYMLAQAMAATAQSMEAQIGLISLSKSVGALARRIGRYSADKSLGTQAKEVRESARDVQQNISDTLQRLGGMKDDTGLKQTLLSSLQQLKDLQPTGKEGSRIVRFVTLRSDKAAVSSVLVAKISADGKPTSARVIPFTKAAAQSVHAERLVPSKPSPLSNRATISILAKTELKKGDVLGKEPIGKADAASGKTVGVVATDKKQAATVIATQKDGSIVEAKGTTPAGAKVDVSGLAKSEIKQTVVDKTLLQADGKIVEEKVAPANAKTADGKAAPFTADGKAASVAAEGKAALATADGVKAVDSKAAPTTMAFEGKTVATAAEAKTGSHSAATVEGKAVPVLPATAQDKTVIADRNGTIATGQEKTTPTGASAEGKKMADPVSTSVVEGRATQSTTTTESHASSTVAGSTQAKGMPTAATNEDKTYSPTADMIRTARNAAGVTPNTTNEDVRSVTPTNSGAEGQRQSTSAHPPHETRPEVFANNGYSATANQSSQKSAPTTAQNMGAATQGESAPIYQAPAESASVAPSIDATANRGQSTNSFADNTVHVSTAFTAPVSTPPPPTQNAHTTPNNSAAAPPPTANDIPINKSETAFKTAEPVTARPEAAATPQNQAAQHQTPEINGASSQVNAGTGTQTFADQNAGKPTAAASTPTTIPPTIIDDWRHQRVSPEQPIREQPARDTVPTADPLTSKQPEPSRVEPAPVNPASPIGGGVAAPINPPTNPPEEPTRNEFKQAAKGACAGCGGGNCAACMRPMSADTNSVKSRFAKLDKG